MSKIPSTARGAGVTLLGQWCKFALQALSLVILARLLEPKQFGFYSMVIAITGIGGVIGDFGFSSASIQAKTISNAQRSNLFWINAAIGAIVSGILALLSGPIARFYGHPELRAVVLVLAIGSVLNALATQFLANFSRSLRFSLLAVIDVVPQLFGVIAAFFFAYFVSPTVWALVVQQLTIPITTLSIAFLASEWHPRLPSRAPMRSFLLFGINTFFVQLLTYATTNIASVILGRTGTPAQVGYYNRADQLNRIPAQQMATPLTRVMLPTLARNQDDLATLQRHLGRALRLISYTVGGSLCAACAMSFAVVDIVLGDQWQASAPLLRILTVGGYFQVMGNVYYWAMLALAKTGMQLRYSVVTRAVMLLVMLLALPYGVEWLAAAASAGLFLNWLVLTLFAIPRTGLSRRSFIQDATTPLCLNIVLGGCCYAMVLLTESWSSWLQVTAGLAIWIFGLSVHIATSRTARADFSSFVQAIRRT